MVSPTLKEMDQSWNVLQELLLLLLLLMMMMMAILVF
jgi:hypothetical protein